MGDLKWLDRAIPVQENEAGASQPTSQGSSSWQSRAVSADPSEDDRPGEALSENFKNSVLAGYLPQVKAGMNSLMGDPSGGVDEKLKAQGFKINQPAQDYVSVRDQTTKNLGSLQQSNPKMSLAGGLGGMLVTAPAVGGALARTGLAAAPASGLLGRVGQAALGGAAQGAIQNPGDTEGQVDLLQGKERLGNAVSGAGTGALFQGGAEAIKKGADVILNLPNTLKTYAQLKAFKSAGTKGSDYTKVDKNINSGMVKKIGQEMLDKGLVAPGSTYEDVAEKSFDLKGKAGQVIGDTYKAATQKIEEPGFFSNLSDEQKGLFQKTTLNTDQFAKDLEGQFTQELRGKAGGTNALAGVKPRLEELSQNGQDANLADVAKFKTDLDTLINYDHDLSKEPLTKQYLYKVRDYLNDKIDERIDALDKILGGNSLASLKDAKQQYGVWSTVSGISKKKVDNERANRFMSLTDTIVGTGGALGGAMMGGLLRGDYEGAAKGAVAGAGLGLLNKGARLYGNPLLTQGVSKLGTALGTIPQPVISGARAGAGFLANRPAILGAAAESNKGKVKKKE